MFATSLTLVLAAAVALALAAERRAKAREAASLSAPGAMVDIGSRRLHVFVTGDGRPGPTVVLETGGGDPCAYYRPLAELIAVHAPVLAYDRAGLGWSDPAPGERNFETLAADLEALLQAARAPAPYVLVGASFGGLVTRAYAAAYPEKVAGMVLVDAAEEALIFPRLRRFLAAARRTGAIARAAAALGLLRRAVLRRPEKLGLPAQALSKADLAQLARHYSRQAHWRAAEREARAYELTPPAQRVAAGFGVLGDLPLVVLAHGKPMAGMHAGLEAGWREGQQRLAALSARGELRVVEDSGHAICLERPEAVAAAVLGVLGQLSRTPEPVL